MRLLVALAVLAALPVGVEAAPSQPGGPTSSTVTYDVTQPSNHARLNQGWGLYATMSGRSMDIGARDLQWSDDPGVQANDVQAGYGWHKGGTSALIGYSEHDFGPKEEPLVAQERQDRDVHHFNGGSGVIGLSFAVHPR